MCIHKGSPTKCDSKGRVGRTIWTPMSKLIHKKFLYLDQLNFLISFLSISRSFFSFYLSYFFFLLLFFSFLSIIYFLCQRVSQTLAQMLTSRFGHGAVRASNINLTDIRIATVTDRKYFLWPWTTCKMVIQTKHLETSVNKMRRVPWVVKGFPNKN